MIATLFQPGSYLTIFGFLVLTGCGMPIPEEVALVVAGVLSRQGKLDPAWAFTACLAGALVGDAIMYQIGARFGHGLLLKHPKLAKLVGADREEHFEQAIHRHGFKVLLLARFMVGVRGPVYLAAGMIRMPFRRFLMWDLVCATLVVGAFFGLAYYYGQDIATLLRDAEKTFTLVVLLVVLAVVFYVLRRQRRQLVERLMREKTDHQAKATESEDSVDSPEKREAS
ncbi:MAG: DedA family protein [Planctomycetales bacterium]|nr:DedA family protein [Planctomycetales bacterium]